MAKIEYRLRGNFNQILNDIDTGILNGSASASFEDGSDYRIGDVRCAVRVYERYSMMGGNRVSLNVTLLGNEDTVCLTGITSGGSQAVLFKLNTWGEEAFLECLDEVVRKYK